MIDRAMILIADDSADDYTLLELSLREAGFDGEVVWVMDGDAAVELLRGGTAVEGTPRDAARSPNLVILDHYLPMKNSLEILEALSLLEERGNYPIVVLSSYVSGDDRQSLVRAGVRSVFEKPADLDGFGELGRTLLALLETEG